ncbi:MAG: VF530 family protein [Bacteroidota bacterium]
MQPDVMNPQPNNRLHGVTLEMVLLHLLKLYRWEDLYKLIKINCFHENPSIKSSLTFLRKTPWARQKVEELYLKSTPPGSPGMPV